MSKLEVPAVIRRVEGEPPRFVGDELSRLAVTYADVFAGDPWREVSRCAHEDGFSDQPVGSVCDVHEVKRTPAYPLDETIDHIRTESEKPDAAFYLLEGQAGIAGFSWGYSYGSIDEFLAAKYAGESPEMHSTRAKVAAALSGVGLHGPFYYLSETGILPEYRGHNYSDQFIQRRMAFAHERGLDVLQRTSRRSAMYNTARTAGFTQIMGKTSSRNPVRGLPNTLNEEFVGSVDDINEDRVLFVKHA